MQDEAPRLIVTDQGDVKVVELTEKKMLDEVNISQIGRRLNALAAEADKPKIVIDFTNVAHMSSSALGMLITLHKRICEKQGELRLCGIAASIYEVFVITRLNEIFRISQSRSEALESLE